MSTRTAQHYTIKEAATLTGLPASTLRYYETVGVIAPISRGASSKHRLYDEDDLDRLMTIACLSATGMSVSDMRQYVANIEHGSDAAPEQIDLLRAQAVRLELEAVLLELRQRYVQHKIDYWDAVTAGDDALVAELAERANVLAAEMRQAKPQ